MTQYNEKDICCLFNKFDINKKGKVNFTEFMQEVNPKLERNKGYQTNSHIHNIYINLKEIS